jgi:hypothetical protein
MRGEDQFTKDHLVMKMVGNSLTVTGMSHVWTEARDYQQQGCMLAVICAQLGH